MTIDRVRTNVIVLLDIADKIDLRIDVVENEEAKEELKKAFSSLVKASEILVASISETSKEDRSRYEEIF